jgi:DNA-binding LytR/AlgR family response regulator
VNWCYYFVAKHFLFVNGKKWNLSEITLNIKFVYQPHFYNFEWNNQFYCRHMEIKVLIVEDEMLVAEDLAYHMVECGFKVTGIAISGEECFESINKEEPDIVIMDINIQGKLDGIEIARIINQTKKIPFIFLTANSDVATVNRAIPLNPDAFISKPFNKNDLKIAIELACQKHNNQVMQSVYSDDINLINHSIFVKEGNIYRRIDVPSVLYIEAKGSYSTIVTSTRSYTLSYNLNYFTTQVKNPVFKRVHRSFIININKVEGIDNSTLLINKTVIPVSKQHQKEIMGLFLKL